MLLPGEVLGVVSDERSSGAGARRHSIQNFSEAGSRRRVNPSDMHAEPVLQLVGAGRDVSEEYPIERISGTPSNISSESSLRPPRRKP